MSKAKKTNAHNKDINKMMDIFTKIPNPVNLIRNVTSDADLRKKLNELYTNEKDGFLAYKLVNYIFATNRSTIKKLEIEEHIKIEGDLFD